MVILHSSVSLPEGTAHPSAHPRSTFEWGLWAVNQSGDMVIHLSHLIMLWFLLETYPGAGGIYQIQQMCRNDVSNQEIGNPVPT